MGARVPVSACAWIPCTTPPGSKSFECIAQDRRPPFMQDFFPTGKRVVPRPGKKRKGAGFPNRNGSRTKRKALRPCGAVCVCEGGPQAEKRRLESLQRGPRPVYATALSHWRRSLAGADTCRNGHKLRGVLRVFPGWKLRPRRSAQGCPSGRVCPRIPCPAPGQESFERYCVIPRAPSYARKIPASDFRQ